MATRIMVTAVLSVLLGCGQSPAPESSATSASAAVAGNISIYAAAVNDPARTENDTARDDARKPAQVMEFFGIQPGTKVLDMFAGGGYYTELLARVVGPDGTVVSHTNQAYAQYVGDEATKRYDNDRLPNVEILMAENNELQLPKEEFDAVILILAFHDIYYVAPDNGWPKIDGPRLLSELHRGMKPGAILGVVDHTAAAGSPRETGGTLHRIDPSIVVSEMQAAGFILEAKSDLLRNLQDDYSKNMADPAVRGRTDRFVMRFRKPG